MKRLIFALFLLLTLTGLGAIPSRVTYAAGVNDFTIEDYQIDYYLDRSADGRSSLKTVESITALFPQTDQNHGIERAIPTSYDGHTTGLKIDSVVDANNQPHNFTTYSSNGNKVVRIGDADKYVHGLVTYKLTYTQKDVTKFFSDTNRDEFYWDTNGTEWRVPTKTLTARLHLSESLSAAATGDTACYIGFLESTDKCSLNREGSTLTTTATNLYPSENITIAVGFKAGTFSPYKPSALAVFLE